MSSPIVYPQIFTADTATFDNPTDGVGFSFMTHIVTGPYVAPPPPPPPARRVLLGMQMPQAAAFPGIGVARRYYRDAQGQTGYNPTGAIGGVAEDKAAGRLTLLSIRPSDFTKPYNPQAMEPYRQAIEDPNTVATPWHEPENDGQPPAVFQSYYRNFAQQFPKAKLMPILMGQTFKTSSALWLSGLNYNFVGADPYIFHGMSVAAAYDPALTFAQRVGKPLIIAETGILASDDQATVLNDIAAYCNDNPDIYAVAYWNDQAKADWRLNPVGVASFNALLKSPPFAPIH